MDLRVTFSGAYLSKCIKIAPRLIRDFINVGITTAPGPIIQAHFDKRVL